MIRALKISTALLICSVFLFRLLFINIGAITSSSSAKTSKSHLSSLLKKRKHVDAVDSSKDSDYSATEICEEDADDVDSEIKSTPLVFIQVLYSLAAVETVNKLNILPSHTFYSDTSSHKYLTFQVFRI